MLAQLQFIPPPSLSLKRARRLRGKGILAKFGEIPKYMERAELKTFLQAVNENSLQEDYAVFPTLAYTSMRIGELFSLKWQDIDFDEQTISITKTLYCPTNNSLEYTLLTPKIKNSIRKIEVSLKVLDELKKQRNRQNHDRIAYGKGWHKKDFVFTADKHP